MNPRVTIATAWRVLTQLRHDRRTLALIFIVPPALLALLRYIFNNQPQAFGRIGAPLVGLFPLVVMFLIASIAVLRERTTGTLERLMSMPLSKLDLLLGYALAFGLVAAVQTGVTAAVAFGLLRMTTAGPLWAVILLAISNAILGMALGLLVSAGAHSEFQAVQFLPAFIVPQLLLAGLFLPRTEMPTVLQHVSDFLPFTYAYGALAKVSAGQIDAGLWLDGGVVGGCVFLALLLGATTLRRRTG